jgi:molecular chaperone HscB
MVQCPSCARLQEPRIVCADCGAPLAARLDLFAALGMPRQLAIETDSLERAYHDLGRRIHPDRFAASPAKVRDASMRATALLTRAYRTLRDPVSRGLYWLELNGHKLAENNKQVPAELAELVFEVQEELSGLRAAREGGEKSAMRGQVEERRAALRRMMDEFERELSRNFASFDAAGRDHADGGRDPLFAQLKSILSKVAYLRTLIRDADRELDSAKAA